ncbi:MAG: AI-2E family transporter [bacterium]|nr:AI-2E family transporter [bacterium]
MSEMHYFKFLPGVTTTALILLILYLSYLVLKPFLFVIVIAFIFSIFLNPIYEWFLARMKNRALSAALSLLLLLLFILLPVLLILGNIVQEARGLLDILQERPTLLNDIQNGVTKQLQSYGLTIDTAQFRLQEEATGLLKILMQNIASSLLYGGSVILNTFFVLITTFYLLIQKKRIHTYLINLQVIPQHYFIQLQMRIVELVNGIVRGNLLVVVIQIVVGVIGFAVFGLPAPILLGLLYGLLSLLPAIGVLLVWVPVATILFINHGLLSAILFVAWFVLTNLAVDNFIAPKIIGSQTKLHQLLIMFSVVGGMAQFGFIGIVLGPVIVALALVAIGMYKELVDESKTASPML